MQSTIQQPEIDWSRNLFLSLSLNGKWGVPRSGLILTKVSDKELRLTELMPWEEGMRVAFAQGKDVPATEYELIEFQRDDFKAIASRMSAAGIKMTDPENLLRQREDGLWD